MNQVSANNYRNQTGININDVQSTIMDQSCFATPTEHRRVASRVFVMEQRAIELRNGFTNYYDFSFPSADSSFGAQVVSTISTSRTFHLRKLASEGSLIASINAGFFFLADDATHRPIDASYNFCMRNGKVIGLPVADQTAVYTENGEIKAHNVKATGIVMIGDTELHWSGFKTVALSKDQAIFFNSACCTINHVPSENTGSKRVLDPSSIFTPHCPTKSDLIVRYDQEGILRVHTIKAGGNSNIFTGNFVIQCPSSNNYRVGAVVTPQELDGISLHKVESGVSIGPNVHHFLDQDDHPINHDSSLGNNPPFENRRMTRSIVYKDATGRVHFFIVGWST